MCGQTPDPSRVDGCLVLLEFMIVQGWAGVSVRSKRGGGGGVGWGGLGSAAEHV